MILCPYIEVSCKQIFVHSSGEFNLWLKWVSILNLRCQKHGFLLFWHRKILDSKFYIIYISFLSLFY